VKLGKFNECRTKPRAGGLMVDWILPRDVHRGNGLSAARGERSVEGTNGRQRREGADFMDGSMPFTPGIREYVAIQL